MLGTFLFTDIVGSTERAAEIGDVAFRPCSSSTTRWSGGGSPSSAAWRSAPRAMASSRSSTGRGGRSARLRDPRRRSRPGSRDPRRAAHRREPCPRRRGQRDRGPPRRPRRALAGAGEVLVSSTVRDLVAGSQVEFDGPWRDTPSRACPASGASTRPAPASSTDPTPPSPPARPAPDEVPGLHLALALDRDRAAVLAARTRP